MRLPIRLPVGLSTNLSSLVLAFVLAIMVWIAATNTELQRLTFPVTERGLPVQMINLPAGMTIVNGDETTIHVDVLLPRGEESILRANDFFAQVDLSGLEAGSQPVPVQVARKAGAPPFRILSWEPDRIDITLDDVITRELQINVDVSGQDTVPQIYQVFTATVNPPTMTLTGPRTLVEPIENVVAELSVAGERASVIEEVTPKLLTNQGEIRGSNLIMEPDQVLVTVPIQQRQGYEELIVRTPIEGEPARGYWVSNLSINPRQVTVVGDPAIVAELDGIVDTAPVQVEGLGEGQITFNQPLQLPEGVSALEENSVEVSISIAPQTSSRRVTLVPQYVGLRPGLVVTNVVPSTVDVLLQGPVNELDDLNLSEVGITLDLTDFAAGTWLVEPIVSPPGRLGAESLIPDQVEVTIEEPRGTRELLLPINPVGLNSSLVAVIDPVSLTAQVEGPVLPLDNLDIEKDAATVDVTGLSPGNYILTPTLAIGNGISVTNLSPTIVTVRIYEREDILAPTASIQVRNLAPGLRATLSAQIAVVRAVGSSTESQLSQNPAFRVEVYVNGLDEGTYTLPLQVRLPSGHFLISVTPQFVEVRIEPDPTSTPSAPP